MSLTLVGLGPSADLAYLGKQARRQLRAAQRIVFDGFTAPQGRWIDGLENELERPVEESGPLDSQQRGELIGDAQRRDVVLAVAGHPLLATPHGHLCKQARAAAVEVRVTPGLSIVDLAAAQLGLDPSRLRVVTVEDPRRAKPGELAHIEAALAQQQSSIVLAVGQPGADVYTRWESLLDKYPGTGQLYSVASDSATLIVQLT